MRKILLTLFCLAVVTTTIEAQPVTSSLWKKTINLPRESTAAASNDLLALTKSGELYATGNFSKNFSFGNNDLEAVAKSTYLIKYDASGNEKWGVAIVGAATPTAITTDEQGNIYLAGVFADQINIGSTDGQVVSKTGVAETTELAAAFLAKYSSEGKLLKVESFVPIAFSNPDLLFFDPAFFQLNKLEIYNGKLYAATVTKGGTITQNNITLKGSYQNSEGWLGANLQSSFIVSFNDDLMMDNLLLSASAQENLDKQSDAFSASLAFGPDGKLYTGMVVTGDMIFTIGTEQKSVSYSYSSNDGIGYNFVVTAINLSDLSYISKTFETIHDKYNHCFLKGMYVCNDKLLLTGTFNTYLPFNNSITPISTDDVFSAALSTSDLSAIWAKSSGINEADVKNEEVLVGSAVSGDQLILTVNTNISEGQVSLTSGNLYCDIPSGTMTAVDNYGSNIFNTGLSANGTKIAKSIVDNKTKDATITFSVEKNDNATSINAPKASNSIIAYPTIVTNTINFSETCNITITNISGSIVEKVANVESRDLSSYAKGIYFVTVSNEQGTKTIKIIKN